MEDLIQSPEDIIAVEPQALEAELMAALTTYLAKTLARRFKRSWDANQESKLQQEISELVAVANKRGLSTIRLIVTRPNGQVVTQDLDIGKISKSRALQ